MAPERMGMTAHAAFDRACRGCGYNLRGLPFAKPCPECGHVGEDRAPDEPIARQDPAVLRLLHRSVIIAHFSWLAIVALTLFAVLRGLNSVMLMIMMAACAGLVLAVWLLTLAIHHPDALMHGFGPRSRLHWPRRTAILGWLLASGCALVHAHAPLGQAGEALRTSTMIMSACGLIIAAGGTTLLCIHLRRLCDWARDHEAASALNLAMWLLAGIAPVTVIRLMHPLNITPTTGEAVLIVALPVLTFLALIGALAKSWGLMLLCGVLRASIRHGREYRELDQRRLERAQRFEAELARRSSRTGVP